MQNIIRILLYLDKMIVRAYHVLQLTNNNQSNFQTNEQYKKDKESYEEK